MATLTVHACAACGQREFPERLLCPACGGRDFVDVDAGCGSVEDVTALHRRPGSGAGELAWLATVRTDAGPRVIAQLEGPLEAGAPVELRLGADGAIRARQV